MPKKAKRRPFNRRPQRRPEDTGEKQRSLDAAARGLLARSTPSEIHSQITDRELLLEEADRAAQLDPNPANLARYRAARSELAAAQRAIELATSAARAQDS